VFFFRDIVVNAAVVVSIDRPVVFVVVAGVPTVLLYLKLLLYVL
jgi:hypothetical protein